ncbi:MAG: IPT/TIG domain-containing protein [Agathobacter sp.]|uniref:alpha-amylase family glycosyl hydrolase n=1 Tax=Agathobacter sp. TaxID=2021311 RepID=UPI002588DBA7|nr:alpha-amylase family glycosyl hydrolase [Agathobacter sp.]MCR5677585.1 IPT/TIG domain-containing protein [Agathobacter sp.]
MRRKALKKASVLVTTVAMTLAGMPLTSVNAKTDADVTNTAGCSTDVIYQIVTDRFVDGNSANNPSGAIFDRSNPKKYHGGDWAGITQKINDGYFSEMGVTALWISSPVENIMTIDPSNQCASYHGYWGKDFFRTNSAFGTMNEFQTLLDTAHDNDIKIIIDFAPNHTSTAEYAGIYFPEDGALYRDGSLVGQFTNDYAGLFNHESWTDFSSLENGIYHSMYGLADLNQMNSTVDGYLKDSIDMWLDMGVDGIRVDAVKHMPQGWQKNWLSSIYEEHDVFVFGEWFNGGTGNDPEMTDFANNSGMSLLDFRYANAVRSAIGDETSSMKDLYQVMVDTASDYDEVNDQVTFIDNHDMSRFMTLSTNNAAAVNEAYVMLLTSRGVPTIYYGSEQYLTGSTDPYNRGDMTSFNRNSTAYRIISKLAPLRKTNAALAYGQTKERWMNDDVLIYERTCGNDVVVTAINRNENASYRINGLYTGLPAGSYGDKLDGIMGGETIQVSGSGAVSSFTLGGGECAVWTYTANSHAATIGNVDPGMGAPGNTIAISGRGFGNTAGTVTFGRTQAQVIDWSDSEIDVQIPSVAGGEYTITVNTAGGDSDSYGGFTVLTASQVATRFFVNNAYTNYGQSLYIVGNIAELGNWNPDKAVGCFFNNTASIANYPTWFYDISLPAGTRIEYKYIKKDAAGNVVWESGSNHVYTTVTNGTGTVVDTW